MVPVPIRDQAMIELGKTRMQYRLMEGRSGLQLLDETMYAAGAGRLTIAADDPLAGLTDRQLEILALVAQGHSNAGIAERLMVSPRTVEAHLHNIRGQLSLPETDSANRRVHAVLAYLRAYSGAEAGAHDASEPNTVVG
jgi:DNA-binding CsgD family transcriptional regulator